MSDDKNWTWAAFGKHPATKDYFRLGEESPFVTGLFGWVENGYQLLTAKISSAPEFCSWRFWACEAGTNAFVCGVAKVSSDSLGRPYPLAIVGCGHLSAWQNNWDLIPFSCEKTWRQIEHIAANLFADFNKLKEQIHTIRPPDARWAELGAKRTGLNCLGSPNDPYASFLSFRDLKKTAVAHAEKPVLFASLDRGACSDKILNVSLWHMIFKETARAFPNAVFIGGTLEKSYLTIFRRPMKPSDFVQLWSASSTASGEPMIGSELSVDISKLGVQPISTEKPGGSDVRYDPTFDELQTEIDKLSSPAVAGTINWEKVCRFATDILMNKSKDLLVAGYLAVGLTYTRRSDGFAVGLKIYRELLERFWDDLYPQKVRMRGRTRAIEWWLEKSEIALTQSREISFPPPQVAIIRENLDHIEGFLRERLEGSPSLSPLKEYFNRVVTDAEESVEEPASAPIQHEKPEETPPPPPEPSHQAPPIPAAQRTIASRHETGTTLEGALMGTSEALYQLWQQDMSNPQAYRLSRSTAWYAINELPPSSNGQTRISSPSVQDRNLLLNLRNNGDPEALLKAAETRLSQYIFWLDINRLVAEALARLGGRYEKAHAAVCEETAFLIHRLPGLEELTFSDGTPFANPDTRQWLGGISFQRADHTMCSDTTSDPAGNETVEVSIESAIREMRNQVGRGKLIEAMETVQLKLRGCASHRDRIMWRLALSRMLIDIGRQKLALPQLEQILKDIEKFRLEEYDPEMAMNAYKLAWVAFDNQTDPGFKERAREILHHIGRVDIPEMVRISKE